MKTAFLCNVSPQWRRKIPRLLHELSAQFGHDHDIFIVDRNTPDSSENHLNRIVDEKFDRIVVAGGDGSLNRTVNFLHRMGRLSETALGVIPLGTCNDFARSLGLRPGQIGKALRAVLKNRRRRVSVGAVNGHCFINNAGFGKRNPHQKKTGPLVTVIEMRPVHLEAFWDSTRSHGTFMMMICANAPYFSGGLHFSKRSSPFDDALEFFLIRKISKAHLFMKLFVGRSGVPMAVTNLLKSILEVRASRLTIRADQPIWLVADGEPVRELSHPHEAVFEVASHCNFIVPETLAVSAG